MKWKTVARPLSFITQMHLYDQQASARWGSFRRLVSPKNLEMDAFDLQGVCKDESGTLELSDLELQESYAFVRA